MKLKPLFRYVGGKQSVIKHYPSLPTNIDSYSEPFCGGAAMLCHIVNSGVSPKVSLNDLDYNVYSVYKYIQENNISEIISETKNLEIDQKPTKQSYKLALQDYNDKTRFHPLVFLWLLRNSFGGCFRYGLTDGKLIMGIGHVLKQQWDKEQLSAWHNLLQQAKVTNKDYKEVSPASFTFVDPPYFDSKYNYQLGRDNEGGANWLSNEIVEHYRNSSSTVWISNRKSPQLNAEGYKIIDLNVVYNLGRRKSETISEILLVNLSS